VLAPSTRWQALVAFFLKNEIKKEATSACHRVDGASTSFIKISVGTVIAIIINA
jgi:hypothetical protein